jgi:hypothetical protein
VSFALLFVGLASTACGGYMCLVSVFSGSIMISNFPYREINRHEEPDRFRFWQRVAAGAFLFGVSVLILRSFLF